MKKILNSVVVLILILSSAVLNRVEASDGIFEDIVDLYGDIELCDYTLYYDNATKKLYKDSDFSEEYTGGGYVGYDGTIALQDFKFATTADKALVVPKNFTISVSDYFDNVIIVKNKKVSSVIYDGNTDSTLVFSGAFGMLTLIADGAAGSYAINCDKYINTMDPYKPAVLEMITTYGSVKTSTEEKYFSVNGEKSYVVGKADDMTVSINYAKPCSPIVLIQPDKLDEGTDYIVNGETDAVTVKKEKLNALGIGTYYLDVCYDEDQYTTSFVYRIVLNVVKEETVTVEPEYVDTSCEAVIGPDWTWDENNGVCKLKYSVVNTSTK